MGSVVSRQGHNKQDTEEEVSVKTFQEEEFVHVREPGITRIHSKSLPALGLAEDFSLSTQKFPSQNIKLFPLMSPIVHKPFHLSPIPSIKDASVEKESVSSSDDSLQSVVEKSIETIPLTQKYIPPIGQTKHDPPSLPKIPLSRHNQLQTNQVASVGVGTQKSIKEEDGILSSNNKRQLSSRFLFEEADSSYSQLKWENFNQRGSTDCIPIDFESLFVTHKTSAVALQPTPSSGGSRHYNRACISRHGGTYPERMKNSRKEIISSKNRV